MQVKNMRVQIWKMQLLYNEGGSDTHLSPLSLK